MIKTLKKLLSKHGALIAIGIIVLCLFINNYSVSKGMHVEGNTAATSSGNAAEVAPQLNSVEPANPAGENSGSASVDGEQQKPLGLEPTCTKGESNNPADLLPNQNNNAWGQLTPNLSNGDLANVNLLDAGYHKGIDTVMGTLRNANLQVRSEPPNPQTSVGPWQNTTIEPDLMRVPLELGPRKNN